MNIFLVSDGQFARTEEPGTLSLIAAICKLRVRVEKKAATFFFYLLLIYLSL